MNADLETLARAQPTLARALSDGWSEPIAAWSRRQWAPPSDPAFEPAMRRALVAEIAGRPGADPAAADPLVAAVERVGGVLTPHHVCPTDGPTFGAIDRVACAGQPGPVLVLAWSGLPMSNTAASGALCFGHPDYGALLREGPELKRQRAAAKDRARDGVTESRVVLVPPELRDALVYDCPMPDRVAEVVAAATPALRAFLPDPLPAESYPAWALRVCERVERRLVGRDDLHYVDLNRVAARYLVEVLADDAHPVTRLLTGPGPAPALDDLSWFYARRPGKRESVATTYAPPSDHGELRARIASGALCPGLVPVFGALRTRSRITLLGGYRQVQYLEQIASAWAAAGLADPATDPGVPGRLITGRLRGRDGRNVYPLDVALGVVPDDALPKPTDPMSVVWEPILARLIANA